ncbi:uncharacterized protein LOC108903292 isoform X2 [Anoplophora glabripennis]|uniref:uncharacterized protein LOC108903292 isoform X2 n=1 Tax=Anoplophora glabripennis TaxID=217634 RepID=UPI000874B0E3|nr:uncharacterized protein LOC108903292 isoform X2 [Anoplophora glabripennis]
MDSGKNIYEGIKETNKFEADDCNDKILFLYAIHNKFYPIVAKAVREKGINLSIDDHCHMFSIPQEEALKFETECPPDVYIKQLDKSYANFINSIWPHRYEDSEKFIELLIEMNDSYGVFLKSTNELVSWILLSMLGQLGVLQTEDEHKRKGYASLITKYMSKQLALKGYNAFGTVIDTNHSSISMFTKLGFRSLGIAMYSHQQK